MTDADLAKQALIHYHATTITRKAWEANVASGKYNPKDGSTTEWGLGDAALNQIIGIAPQPPAGNNVVVAPPQGSLTVHDGGLNQSSYEFLYAPQALAGGDIGDLDIRNYTGYGLGIMSWNPQGQNTTPFNIHDLKVSGISANPPRSSNGTAEAGLWLAQLANLSRIEFGPGNAWMDLWTGGLGQGGHYTDLLFTHPEGVAIYHEHVTSNLVVENFKILQGRSGQSNPINVEWTYGGQGSSSITWRAFEIYCPAGATGIFLDAGTYGCTIGDPSPNAPLCIFTGPGDAIGLPNNLAGPTKNIVNTSNIVFKNTGQQVYYHNNGIGAQKPGEVLHPHTVRMDTPLSERFSK